MAGEMRIPHDILADKPRPCSPSTLLQEMKLSDNSEETLIIEDC
jgi:hypothetical protein